MKATLLDGSREDDSDLKDVGVTLKNKLQSIGYEVEILELRDHTISPCTGCFNCWVKTPGICTTDDASRDVSRKYMQSDIVIFLTPISFGGYSSTLKKALDRSLGMMLPYFTKVKGKVHHKKRYKHYPTLGAIGMLPAPNSEEERIFKDIVSRNATNAHAPNQASEVIVKGADKENMEKRIRAFLGRLGVEA
jgi:multimeric flavodoxin WrbA